MLNLSVETEIASHNVVSDVARHVGPPVVMQNHFQGLEPSRMSCELCIVTERDNAPSEVRVLWDVDTTSEVKEAISIGPFGGAYSARGRLPK